MSKAFYFVNAFSVAAVTAEQFDLITDDPRHESERGPWAELQELKRAAEEMGGLLTPGQAAQILGVSRQQINTWLNRGRLSSRTIADVRMVSGGEVAALYHERQKEIRTGGRGHKAPSLATLAKEAWDDISSED